MVLFVYRKKGPSGDSAQKTKIPPPMTPKITAHPVANILAKRPAAPPLLIEPPLVGDGDEEDLLLVREDEREEGEGVRLGLTEDVLGGGVTLDWVEE